ncbi:UDP-N-acetylmuramoyl-L-alanine--D-glutamate ligase [Candidatus Bipolaricaulota bacterium]|nr:UDP-N-acetylmuramoyl-L-alanine--D-glutamate ligase [Candidatus Bipolaricaulota bacterium]
MISEERFARRIAVVGYGRTGQAVVRFLNAVAPATHVLVSERTALSKANQDQLRSWGVRFEQGGHRASFLCSADLVILSPGVHPGLPALNQVRDRRIPVISELDLGSMMIEPERIVAVTGTNGKSSTVELISRLLRRAGHQAVVAGNIGTPLVELLIPPVSPWIFVVEASSFQLEQCVRFQPHVAVWLNLTPDHLSRHGSMAAYASAKKRIFALQRAGDWRVVPPDQVAEVREPGIQVESFTASRIPTAGAWRWIDDLPEHQRANLAAAVSACRAVDGDFRLQEADETILRDVARLPYRMQRLEPIGGVEVVNDSKSTNAGSTLAAVSSVKRPVVLLLGGREKHGGYDLLFDDLRTRGDVLHGLVLFGEAGAMFAEMAVDAGIDPVSIRLVQSLSAAVDAALAAARTGDVLLFSPGCSSFDQYRDYLHRGAEFSKLVDRRRRTVLR